MFFNLKNHPFAVDAFFETSIVLTFAFPVDQLIDLIPECLTLDTYKDKWGFVAVAIVKAKKLRPKGFSSILGNDFVLIGYRIFVKYESRTGKRLRGLYILKSETDTKLMSLLGNLFTGYKYTSTDIACDAKGEEISILSKKSGIDIQLQQRNAEIPLPDGSPFENWKEARRFAGPLPFTFSYHEQAKEVLIIEGMRENWIPAPLKVNKYKIDYLRTVGSGQGLLANAFIVTNVPYLWEKGKVERWA